MKKRILARSFQSLFLSVSTYHTLLSSIPSLISLFTHRLCSSPVSWHSLISRILQHCNGHGIFGVLDDNWCMTPRPGSRRAT
ncbi:hypothetical protein EDD16DRAFT_953029 [Pisolithus croceorrhizus]|nr:hypothetical protein EDD16DRAFT_953029 [Pisolithus croceorrhizus]